MKKKILYWIIGIFAFLFIIGILIPDNSENKITTKTISEEKNIRETLEQEEKFGSLVPDNSDKIAIQTISEEINNQEVFQQEETVSKEIINENFEEDKGMYLVTRIIDGDTIEISTGERIRLICIDTPERGEYYYSEASNYLAGLILNEEVELTKDISETDRYGRLLRYIYIEGDFVNELIVHNGYGKAYPYSPDTSKCPIIQQAEQHAKTNNLGIWEETLESTTEAGSNSCGGDSYNCGDFSSCSEVMEVFNSCSYDVNKLDRDDDGIPCESLCG